MARDPSQDNDPFTGMRFWVEVENEVKAAFSIMQGLSLEIEVKDVPEGGRNHAYHKKVDKVKYANLVLKQGLTTDDYFWDWIDQVRNGTIVRRTITIIVTDPTASDRISWSFLDAFPVKWVGPELSVSSNAVALQTLEFAHEGLIKS